MLGEEVENHCGESLRKAQKEEFRAIAKRVRFAVFPGSIELLRAVHDLGIRTALATSSDELQLEATMASAGVDLTAWVDVVVTTSEADESKPAPDIVVAAVERLALSPAQCAMVGDTVYDALACVAAGVVFIGVLSGGTPADALLEAGALAVWRDVAHLLADLDRALEIVSTAAAASNSSPTSGAPYP